MDDDVSPRFRQDLEASNTEADGVSCVDVRDIKTGASFRFYDFEYQLALQLNGQPLAQVTAWASMTYGADLTPEGIGEFVGRLWELGFLETDEALSGAPSEPALAGADSAEQEWLSPQGTKTAQFVPDPAMLERSPDLTPVAPIDLALAASAELNAASGTEPQTEPRPATKTETKTAASAASASDDGSDTTVRILPPLTVNPLLPAPGAPASPASVTESARSRWALELDGALRSDESPATAAPPLTDAARPTAARQAPAAKEVSSPPAAVTAPPPPGLSERRQPPAPEAVVMAAFTDDAAAKKRAAGAAPSGPSRLTLVLVLLLAVAAASVGYFVWTRQHAAAPQALRVRVVSPEPTAVYRWFSGRGAVTDYETSALAFTTSGRITELLPPGADLVAGDVVGKLRGANAFETLLAHNRSRVAFYRQMRDSMRAAGNLIELRRAESKLAEKEGLVEYAQTALARFTVAATEPGEVVETLAKVGAPIIAGAPVARVKGRLLHGAFDLDAEERVVLAKLDFCRVEVVGLGPRAENAPPRAETGPSAVTDSGPPAAQAGPRFIECRPPGGGATASGDKTEVALPGDLGLVSGQPLRLARRRYDAVFPVPAPALVGDGAARWLWIAGRDGRAESRAVTVADLDDEALISEGLHVGDQVIVDPPPNLRPGTRVAPTPEP
jgi:hypothetical protein